MELQDKEIKVEIKLVPETMVVEEEEQVPQELMQLPLHVLRPIPLFQDMI